MKKFLSVSLAVLLTLSIMVGCGKEVNDTPTVASDPTPEVGAEPTATPNSKYGQIRWSSSKLAKLLPVPKSSVGGTIVDNPSGYTVYIAETSFDDYYDYVVACEEAGFTVDYFKGDDYFYGNNSDGYGLILLYDQEECVMSVDVYPLDETYTPAPASTEEPTEVIESSAGTNSDEVTPEFKEMMDSYEAFIDEYIEFLINYNNSKQTPELLRSYADYMTKYNELTATMDEVLDGDSMSEADAYYALDTLNRIEEKTKNFNDSIN